MVEQNDKTSETFSLDRNKQLSQNASRRRKRYKELSEVTSPEELHKLLNNKNIIAVGNINLGEYIIIDLSNHNQIIEIANQEYSPIYHAFIDNIHKFIVTIPEKKLGYVFSTEIF